VQKRALVLALSLWLSPAQAQVVADQVAGFGIPPQQPIAPNTPGGGVVVGAQLWTGDGAQGFRHWMPSDPANPDPINAGTLEFDSTSGKSLGGGQVCVPFCQVGQVAYDGNQTAYLAVYDHAKGQPFGLTQPGVWRVMLDGVSGFIMSETQIAPSFGLAGDEPTALALGPDGNLYVGFLKNGNIKRVVNPLVDPFSDINRTQIVQSVGTSPNGRPVRSIAFVGNDLYMGTTEALAVITNAVSPQCQGGCNAVVIADGFIGGGHVGLTSDGINRLYVAVNGNGVWRYTISNGAMARVSIDNFAFVGGHSNLLMLDRLGNLWIGDDTSDGHFNFTGRIWRIPAARLAQVP
jgi:hypothetical protein